MMSEDQEKKKKGEEILKNFKNQIIKNPETKEWLSLSKKNKIIEYGFPVKKKLIDDLYLYVSYQIRYHSNYMLF